MFARMAKAVIVLPGTALVVVPGLILWATSGTAHAAAPAAPGQVPFWLGLAAAAVGASFGGWSARLFVRLGDGTPAPWDPPRKLVVAGPYRYVRNPMITGVLFMLAGEALLAQSWPIAAWGAVFFAANAVYFPLVEEKGLVGRFGDDYRTYKANVPRWIPRLTPWRPPSG